MWPYVLTVDSLWSLICVLRYLVATLLAALLGSLTWVWPGKDYWLHPPRRFKTAAEETWTIGTTCSRSMSLGISILASASTSVFRMLEAYRHGSTVWLMSFLRTLRISTPILMWIQQGREEGLVGPTSSSHWAQNFKIHQIRPAFFLAWTHVTRVLDSDPWSHII